MSKVRVHISTSLDGYVAGPNESMENPLGEGGERLHDWLVELKSWREHAGMDGGVENVSNAVFADVSANVGAEIMGRGKFGPPQRGPWGDDRWRGWWGEDPPFHKPVFVLTHHELELHVAPILLGGGARLFDGVGPKLRIEPLRVLEAPGVTHLKYRVVTGEDDLPLAD